jgi:hypothetical protein
MKTYITLFALALTFLLSSCLEEDPGPRQQDTRNYSIVDFDRVEAGYGLVVTISKSSTFSIQANGDRRNLDDLVVTKSGNSLVLSFNDSRKRQYLTNITIMMPALRGVNFSGAVNGTVSGFGDNTLFDVALSGASLAQLEISATELNCTISGASQLRLSGKGEKLTGNISGASILSSFEFPVAAATLNVSGASNGRVSVSQQLKGTATGASLILYRGQPTVDVESSGESMVRKD